MKVGQRITVQIRSSEGEHSHIRLSDFLDQLRAVMASLQKTETLYYHTQPSIFYRIAELTYSSPARVVLVADTDASESRAIQASHVVRAFSAALTQIDRKGKTLGKPNLTVLQAYRDLAPPVSKHVQQVSISIGNRTVSIDKEFKAKVTKIIGPDELVGGSISGMLEMINLHNKKNAHFTVYPTSGPEKVVGRFRPSLRQAVKDGIDKFVTVHGKLRFKSWDNFPHAIDADEIDIHPDDADLPKLKDLRGRAPNATRGLSTEDFMEKIREEW